MRGKQGVRVFMTSPHGRMSPFQQAQMFSLQDANIHNIAIEGVFDDCQDIVKAVSNDHAFKRKYKIGTVNSINWARLLAQVVYYFAGYCRPPRQRRAGQLHRALGQLRQRLRRPRGAQMGLPIDRWWWPPTRTTCSTSSSAPASTVRGSADTHETSSPSMDISKASNFERFVFDLLGRDARAPSACSASSCPARAFDLQRRPAFAEAATRTALPAAAAPMPTGWRPSATTTSAMA
jgi:threonine synthase